MKYLLIQILKKTPAYKFIRDRAILKKQKKELKK